MCVVARVRGDQIQRKQQSVGAILPEANPEALMNINMRVYTCAVLRLSMFASSVNRCSWR